MHDALYALPFALGPAALRLGTKIAWATWGNNEFVGDLNNGKVVNPVQKTSA